MGDGYNFIEPASVGSVEIKFSVVPSQAYTLDIRSGKWKTRVRISSTLHHNIRPQWLETIKTVRLPVDPRTTRVWGRMLKL
jgi:hypothetical protein